jgi:putative component of membrane protein insertase Oxa1/YidC/SpoIIIJ protein YidD
MKLSIERFGVVKGVSLGIKRIMRCHNKKEITIDMVPTKEDL